MSRCVVIAAGPYQDPAALAGRLEAQDVIIAADGGWRLAQQMGLTPSVLVADFDSLPEPADTAGVKVFPLPVEKDATDTAEAMRIGYENGHRTFLLLGCTGGRLDHFPAALAVAGDYCRRGCSVVLADETNEIHLLAPGSYVFPADGDEAVSLFALGEPVSGLFATGLYYDVTDRTLSPYDADCVSNRCTDGDLCLSFRTGTLAVYFSRD